ncbi:Cytoplasmic protein, partial [Monkeypox virus]
EEIAKYGHSFN